MQPTNLHSIYGLLLFYAYMPFPIQFLFKIHVTWRIMISELTSDRFVHSFGKHLRKKLFFCICSLELSSRSVSVRYEFEGFLQFFVYLTIFSYEKIDFFQFLCKKRHRNDFIFLTFFESITHLITFCITFFS